MISRLALAALAALAALVAAPAPAPACSYRPRPEAVRVSGEDGRGRRPWFFVRVVFHYGPHMLDQVVLRRVKRCRRGRVCRGTAIPLERAGDYVRPTVELAPGRYQLSTEMEALGDRVALATFTVGEPGPRAPAASGPVHAFVRFRDPRRDTCADGTPDVYLMLDDSTRGADLRERLLLVYDRAPDPSTPLAGVVKVVRIEGELLEIRSAGPAERWAIAELPDPLWVAVSDDDGGLSAPIRVERR